MKVAGVEISNPDKLMYPDKGYTKADIVQYYHRVSGYILPFLKDRPLTLQRFPDGINSEGFYQKNAADYFPNYINRVTIETQKGSKTQVYCNSEQSLIYLVNQGTITFHTWLSKVSHLNNPDKVVFDLDPPEGEFTRVKRATRILLKFLKSKKLEPQIMITGKSGVHLWYDVEPKLNFDDRREQIKGFADELERQHPELFTTEMRIADRENKVFIDYLRNAYGQTSVCPYSLRPVHQAPVATPVSRETLARLDTANHYNIQNIFRRLGQIRS